MIERTFKQLAHALDVDVRVGVHVTDLDKLEAAVPAARFLCFSCASELTDHVVWLDLLCLYLQVSDRC